MEDNTFQRLAKNDPTLTKLDWSHLENSDIKLLMKSLSWGNSSLVHLELRACDFEIEEVDKLLKEDNLRWRRMRRRWTDYFIPTLRRRDGGCRLSSSVTIYT